jgi:CubicO group peptidase (beta-lactamase class C family)
MRTALTMVLAATLAASQPLPLSTPDREGFSPDRLQRMREVYERVVRDGERSGAITLLARNGKIVDWHAYGYRDVEARLPMEKDTIVRLYSMTKAVASVAALMLIEEGKLSLRDPADKYAPELKQVQVYDAAAAQLVPHKRPITVEHLLTHTSGFGYPGSSTVPAIEAEYKKLDLFGAPTLKEFVAAAAKLPLIAHPGDEYNYGISVDILGYVVQQASGMPFDRFVETRVLAPLKMHDTHFVVPQAKAARVAKIYKPGPDNKLVEESIPEFKYPGGGHALFGTIGDYARFAQMLLNGGELDGARILSRKMVELMTDNHLRGLNRETTAPNGHEGFGLGVAVRTDIGKGSYPGSIGEFGWSGAANTFFRVDPKEKTVALLFMQHFPHSYAALERFQTMWTAALK